MKDVNIALTVFVCGISNATLNDHLVLPYKQIFILFLEIKQHETHLRCVKGKTPTPNRKASEMSGESRCSQSALSNGCDL